MGESLERVQNKFACIIGELCNEPVVLSKFAIWLDLRLAEYKAKGAISLDGFGENPDPSWLKGHEKEDQSTIRATTPLVPAEDLASWNLSTIKFPFGGEEQFSKTEPLLSESITYQKLDSVSVKSEIVENDVEIITQWPEQNRGIKSNKQNYKRVSDTNLNSGSSSEKNQKLSGKSRSPSTQDPTNESLVSIIAKSNDDMNTIDNRISPISNSVTTNFNVAASDVDTAHQLKGDNSRSLSHYAPLAVSSYTSGSSVTTTTEISRSAQPYQPFSPLGSELVLAQDQSEILELQGSRSRYSCPICGRECSRRFSLMRHLRVHQNNSKNFICLVCGRSFREKHHLKKHHQSKCGEIGLQLPGL